VKHCERKGEVHFAFIVLVRQFQRWKSEPEVIHVGWDCIFQYIKVIHDRFRGSQQIAADEKKAKEDILESLLNSDEDDTPGR
jgi:hypothetical protein